MKPRLFQSAVVAALLVLGLAALVAGCMGAGDETSTSLTVMTTQETMLASSSTGGEISGILDAEEFSTFKSKDPFIQQALPPSTTSTTAGGGGSGSSTSTTIYSTSTTRYTTTTYRPPTSTTRPPTSTTTTTAAHKHTLKILSIGVVGGSGAVTFQVDNSIYKDKREGDVVSTSWGQIQVLDINSTSKVVTLLHGSETRVLTVGSVVYE